MKQLLIIIIIIIISSEIKSQYLIQGKDIDTIKPKFIINNKLCSSKAKGYYKKYGLIISNFYEIVDYSIINFGKENEIIVILSPINMILPSYCTICNKELKSNRLLLLIQNENKYLFDNVIRNEFGIGTIGVEEIIKSNNGFSLNYHMGQSCFFDYSINIYFLKNNFYIDRINLKSGCPGKNILSKEYKYSNNSFPLSFYKRTIIDSLKNINNM